MAREKAENVKPNTLVKWQQNNLTMTGRIIHNGGNMAQVAANGNTYEVIVSQLRVIKTCVYCDTPLKNGNIKYCSVNCRQQEGYQKHLCAWCGKPTKNIRNRHCCRRCQWADDNSAIDNLVFAALVEYKRQHQGATPTLEILAAATNSNWCAMRRSINRMGNAGRLSFEGHGADRHVIVTGGKWTYTEPSA